MRFRTPIRFALVFALVYAGAREARAEPSPSLDLRGITPSTDPRAGLMLEPADVPEPLSWNAALWLRYAYRPFTLRNPATDDIRFTMVRHHLSGDLTAGIGLFERAALGVDLPFLMMQTGDKPTVESEKVLGEGRVASQGLGDLALSGKLLVLKPEGRAAAGFVFSVMQRFSFPTGDEASYMGEGHITSETRLLLDLRLKAITVHTALGVKFRGEPERFACAGVPEAKEGEADACATRMGHELPFGLGVTVRPEKLGLDPKGLWTLFLETHGYVSAWPVAPFSAGSARISAVRAGFGARLSLHDFALSFGLYGAPLSSVGAPWAESIFSVAWSPRVYDTDGDGIDDKLDKCPAFAEDFDGFEDGDGCPEADNDQDGVPDGEDRCATEKEDIDQFEDNDGCIDDDNDGDGFADKIDACPNEKGLKSRDPKKVGCPETDLDRDGVEGDADKCPDAAEDVDGFEDGDGCPDYDNDEDGIPDKLDACQNVAGIDSPNEKERGCPDSDRDRDTYVDAEDQCPGEAETWNGIEDGDGCPERGDDKKGTPIFTVKEEKDGLSIQFNSDLKQLKAGAGEAETEGVSMILLRAIASELLKHPDWKLEIGVRPANKAEGAQAKARAEVLVKQVRALARRPNGGDFAEAVDFEQVKKTPSGARFGIGFGLSVKGSGHSANTPANPKHSTPKGQAPPTVPNKPK